MYGFYQQPYGEQLIRVTGIDVNEFMNSIK